MQNSNDLKRKVDANVEEDAPNAKKTKLTNYQGPSKADAVKGRKQFLSQGQYHFYEKPLMLVEAKGQYCYDEEGKRYLDAYSNVCHVGYCHDHVIDAATEQMKTIVSNTRYVHPTLGDYASKLVAKMPKDSNLSVCYFTNSGSEANDLAIRLARVYTRQKYIFALENAYHGTTGSCTGVSPSLSTGNTNKSNVTHPDYAYYGRNVKLIRAPDTYRGDYRADDPKAYLKYADDVEKRLTEIGGPDVVDTECGMGEGVAAFIIESIQGVGGQIIYPEGYVQEVFKRIRKAGGICIADEVQVGFGRMGTHFWAFETDGVIPDIVTMGKPIGNGHPLGCVVTTPQIAEAFETAQYFNTFGGNPVSCAIGRAVLEVIEKEGLQQNALVVGKKFMAGLNDLKNKYNLVGDVRGRGLFLGIEFVRDRTTLEPATWESKALWEMMRERGVLIGLGGPCKNVIRIKPPICFTSENVDEFVQVMGDCLKEITENGEEVLARLTTNFNHNRGEEVIVNK
jgi:4-aminobutyrate aminotransferase-like enzyme